VNLLDPKGPKLIAVGERLCAKPTGVKQQRLKALEWVKQSAWFDPFRVADVTDQFRGLRAKPLTHGY